MEPKPCYVYMLLSVSRDAGRKTYVGWTHDLAARLARHNSGRGAKATRGYQWALIHWECFKTRGAAMAREYALKRDRATRRALVARYLETEARVPTQPLK